MTELRRTALLLGACARSWGPWTACVAALTVGWSTRMAGVLLGPWLSTSHATQAPPIGWLIGLYMGLYCISRINFAVDRLGTGVRTWSRFVFVGLHVGGAGGAAWVGAGGEIWTGTSPLALVWGTVLISALAACLAPHLSGPGRATLATVALAWWIPAVLPPSFLVVVLRALRSLLVVGPEVAVPSEPRAWMADTALVAGLLLLAWAPRRATPRHDEVRHPG